MSHESYALCFTLEPLDPFLTSVRKNLSRTFLFKDSPGWTEAVGGIVFYLPVRPGKVKRAYRMDEPEKTQAELQRPLAQHEAACGPSDGHEQMRQKHGLFREVVDRFVDAVILIDGATGEIGYTNAAACRVLGYEASALEEKHFSILLPPSDRMSAQALLEEMKAYDGVFTQALLLANGVTCTMDMTATIVRWQAEDFVVLCLRDITERTLAEQERERLTRELKEAIARVQTLSGLLPICAWCKRVRDDKGYWKQIETYIRDHSEVDFSHGLCPDCQKRLHKEYFDQSGDDPAAS